MTEGTVSMSAQSVDLPQYIKQVLDHADDFSDAVKDLRSAIVDLKATLDCKKERRLAGLDMNHRHLVLNMDINKTILMRDKVSGKDVREIVNEVLSDAAWGVVIHGIWVIVVSEPSVHRPAPKDDECRDIISYNEWLYMEYPGVKNKHTRNQRNADFTSEGGPGASL